MITHFIAVGVPQTAGTVFDDGIQPFVSGFLCGDLGGPKAVNPGKGSGKVTKRRDFFRLAEDPHAGSDNGCRKQDACRDPERTQGFPGCRCSQGCFSNCGLGFAVIDHKIFILFGMRHDAEDFFNGAACRRGESLLGQLGTLFQLFGRNMNHTGNPRKRNAVKITHDKDHPLIVRQFFQHPHCDIHRFPFGNAFRRFGDFIGCGIHCLCFLRVGTSGREKILIAVFRQCGIQACPHNHGHRLAVEGRKIFRFRKQVKQFCKTGFYGRFNQLVGFQVAGRNIKENRLKRTDQFAHRFPFFFLGFLYHTE